MGNETADCLAKEGSASNQPNPPISYDEKRRLIKEIRRTPPLARDAYHTLNRQQQVIILRLRTGHNRLKAHLQRKFKIGNGKCECEERADQDAEHILQHCRLYEDVRLSHWPGGTDLNTKLHGPHEELVKTANFIVDIGLSV